MIFRAESAQGDLNGFIDRGSHIHGELHFEDTFRVDGRLTGKIVSRGSLVVGERGEVDGTVETGKVLVSGTVRGQIKAAERIEIAAGGRVLADIETPALIIEEGGFFQGQCGMTRPGEVPARKPERGAVVAQMPIPKDA